MSDELEAHLAAGAQARGERRLDAATTHYAAALAVARRSGEPLRVAHVARHLGDIHRENGRPGEAAPLLREAVDAYRSSLETKVLDLANALRALALLHASLGEHRPAREAWQEARTLYSAIGIADGVAECDRHLAADA